MSILNVLGSELRSPEGVLDDFMWIPSRGMTYEWCMYNTVLSNLYGVVYISSYRIRLSSELNPAATPPSSLSLPFVRNR